MMQLGPIQFGIGTAAYQQLTRTAEYVWGEQERFMKNPALQFTGVSAQAVSLEGVFYPEFRGAYNQVSDWRDVAAVGIPYMLVDGRGAIWGDWVIEAIEEKQSIFAVAGAARKTEFSMRLKFYTEGYYSQEQRIAAGNINAVPVPEAVVAGNVASGAASTMDTIAGTINSAITGIQDIAHEVSQTVQPAIDAAMHAVTVARTLQNSALDAGRLVKQIKSINSLSSAQRAFGGLMAASSNAANAGSGLSQILKGIGAKFASDGEPPAAISAIKTALVGVNQMTSAAGNINKQSSDVVRKFT